MELVLKTSDPERDRGFESHLLRQFIKNIITRCFALIALVAQLDRASDFESVGRGFESLRARHLVAP